MKIRADYVTNSSSSSFILGFASEDTIESDLRKSIPKDLLEIVLNDVKIAPRMDAEDAASRICEEESYSIELDVADKYFGHYVSFSEKLDWIEGEGEQMVNEALDKFCDFVQSNLDKDKIYVEIEYEDHTDIGSELEHRVLPNCPNTIRRFSYH